MMTTKIGELLFRKKIKTDLQLFLQANQTCQMSKTSIATTDLANSPFQISITRCNYVAFVLFKTSQPTQTRVTTMHLCICCKLSLRKDLPSELISHAPISLVHLLC